MCSRVREHVQGRGVWRGQEEEGSHSSLKPYMPREVTDRFSGEAGACFSKDGPPRLLFPGVVHFK